GHLVPARGGRHPGVVLAHGGVTQEHHAARRELADRGRDVTDPPAEHGVAGPRGLRDRRHPEHGAVGVQHADEVAALGHGQAERLLVERLRPGQVAGSDERDYLTRLQHGWSPCLSRPAHSPVGPPPSSLTISRWPVCRAYSWSKWNSTRSSDAGSAPSHRSEGWPVSARSWDSITARLRSAWARSAAIRSASVSCAPTYHRPSRLSAHGSPMSRPSNPHSSQRRST